MQGYLNGTYDMFCRGPFSKVGTESTKLAPFLTILRLTGSWRITPILQI